MAIVGIHRERRQGLFDEGDAAALTAVLPHIQRLLAIRSRLSHIQQNLTSSYATLDLLATPVMRTDRNGRVLYANLEGERLLLERDGLFRSRTYGLAARIGAECANLRAAIASACAGEGGSLSVSRAAGRRPLALIAIPVPSNLVAERGEALLLISDPERRTPALAERLRGLFGLTEAEAEVAVELAAGCRLTEIGEARGVKVSTLRDQMSSILAKTDTNRQAQLAALIGRLAALG